MIGQLSTKPIAIGSFTSASFQISFTSIYSHAQQRALLISISIKQMKVSIRNTIIVSLIGLIGAIAAASFDDNFWGSSNNNNNNNGNGNGNDRSNEDYYQSVYRDRVNRRRHHKCPTQRLEHQVVMKKFSDSTGYWVLYTQIIETRNVANQCHRNEYIYLAHRQRAGWLWNPKYNSLVQYSLGEPKFIGRRVKHPSRPHVTILVNMSMNYAAQTVDLDRVFPKRLAKSISYIGPDDMKWSEVARTSLPVLQMTDAYFELVKPEENSGVEKIKVLKDHSMNREVLE